MAYEALLLQLGERRPSLLDVVVGDRPVNLVEVDRLHAEARQASFGLAQDRLALQAVHERATSFAKQRAFREHIRTLREAFERAADDLLGMAEAVRRGGVDPVDAA